MEENVQLVCRKLKILQVLLLEIALFPADFSFSHLFCHQYLQFSWKWHSKKLSTCVIKSISIKPFFWLFISGSFLDSWRKNGNMWRKQEPFFMSRPSGRFSCNRRYILMCWSRIFSSKLSGWYKVQFSMKFAMNLLLRYMENWYFFSICPWRFGRLEFLVISDNNNVVHLLLHSCHSN